LDYSYNSSNNFRKGGFMIRISKFTIMFITLTISALLNAVQLEITPTISKAFKTNNDSLRDSEVLYGVRGNLYFNKNVAIQVGGEASTSNKMEDGGETDIERGYVNLIHQPSIGDHIHPYTIVGGGYEKIHRINRPRNGDDSQPFLNIGAGIKYDINDRVNIVTEAKWLRKLENNDNDVIATLGLGVKLGEISTEHKDIPSVTETSDVQNAISLAEFRKIQETKKVKKSVKQTVPVVAAATAVVKSTATASVDPIFVQEDTIPENAIILGEYESVESTDVISDSTLVSQTPDESVASDSGYYVQLAAVFGGVSPAVLTNRLESKNYHYIIKDVQRFGKQASLVLVGPYASRTEAGIAKKYLKKLKSDAFIYHLN
jgi:hypothetical protein